MQDILIVRLREKEKKTFIWTL